MPYFKDKTGGVHFLDDAAFKHLLPQGCIEITDAEAEILQTPPLAPDELIKQQIAALEATISERRKREAILGTDNGWLAGIEAQIAALRAQLE